MCLKSEHPAQLPPNKYPKILNLVNENIRLLLFAVLILTNK